MHIAPKRRSSSGAPWMANVPFLARLWSLHSSKIWISDAESTPASSALPSKPFSFPRKPGASPMRNSNPVTPQRTVR